MSSELSLIIAIVVVLVYLQVRLIKNGKEKINLLQSIFGTGLSDSKSLKKSKKLYETKEVFIPKHYLKKLSWEEIKNNITHYSYYKDDVKIEKIPDTKEYSRRKSLIEDLIVRLKHTTDEVDFEVLEAKLTEEEDSLRKDEAAGKFESTKRTVVCKKEDKEKIEIILINNTNPVAKEIEKSINTYLLRNKGAVSDFNLIKDIVERNSDAVATEIESVTPMPLYLGLAGTMSGIVVGLGLIGLTTGFNNIQNVVDSLMSEVALAMLVSLLGVLSTTYLSWKSRTCNSIIESDKNKFYTWVQTELLPVLSSNTVSTLTLLERNLSKFNESFGATIVKLDEKLSKVGETYGQQLEILRRIEELDVTKMATANVKILKALDSSSGNIENFARYMDNSTTYLSEVRKLTDELDGYLARTGSLETIADFYKKQMNEIASRQDAIKTTVISVDDTMQKALANLEEHTEKGLTGLKQTYIKQQDEMEKIAQQQGGLLTEKLAKIDVVIAFIEKLQPLLGQISKMETAINNAANRADSAARSEINAINNLAEAIKKNRTASYSTSRQGSGVTTREEAYGRSEKKGFFSSITDLFKRKKITEESIIDTSKSEKSITPPIDSSKGQWYEQGRNKRINKS